MTADLPPDVRAEAAQAASDARREYDNATLYVNEAGRNLHIVDAVSAVVAPEIARQLQARIAELEAEVPSLSCPRDCEPRCAWTGITEGELIQHYIDVHHSPTQDAYDSVSKAYWKRVARVELLTAALTELTNAVVSWNGHPEPAHVMVMDAAAARARAALAAGVTESEDVR